MKTEEEIKKQIQDAEINISMAQERIEEEEVYCKKLGDEIEILKWVLTETVQLPKKIKATPAPNEDDEY